MKKFNEGTFRFEFDVKFLGDLMAGIQLIPDFESRVYLLRQLMISRDKVNEERVKSGLPWLYKFYYDDFDIYD